MTFRLGYVTGATPDKWARIWGERERERIELVPTTEPEQLDGVRDGSLDMALVRLPVDRDGLHLIPLYDELQVVVLEKDDTLTLHDEVPLDELEDGHVVVPMSVARAHGGREMTYRPVPELEPTTVGLAWLVSNEDPRVQKFIGIVRGRTANSSR